LKPEIKLNLLRSVIMQNSKPLNFDRVARVALYAALLWALVWLLEYLSDVLIPFAAALLMAYMLNPLVVLVQKKIPSRAMAVSISLLLVVALLALAFILVTPMVIHQIQHMGALASNLITNSELAAKAKLMLPDDIWRALFDYVSKEDVQKFFKTDSVWKLAEPMAKKVFPGIWGVISGAAGFLLGIVGLTVIVLYLIFLLADYQSVKEGWKKLIPPAHREAVVGFVYEFDASMNRYFRAQAAVASIVGILFAIGFTLIGLPMGILLGLFIGLLNMVPYLQVVGLIPASLLAMVHALETDQSIWLVLGLTALVFAVIQIIQDAFLTPKIMGKVTGMSPAIIMLSLSVWGKILGMLGLLIALPVTALLHAYYKKFIIKEDDEPEEKADIESG